MRNLTFILLIMMFSCKKETPEPLPNNFIQLLTPTNTPQKFGDGVISTSGTVEFGVVYDHANHDLYFTRLNTGSGATTIYTMHDTGNNNWEQPKVASFSGTFRDACPVVVKNGARIYFTSSRNSTFSKIWVIDRNNDKSWGEPQAVIFPDSVKTDIRNICFVNDSVFYFDMLYKNFNNDIFRGVIRKNRCIDIQHTGNQVNSSNPDIEAAVNPAETYMIFYSIGRTGHIGNSTIGDLYISYKKNGMWSTPENVGTPINSTNEENWPTIDVATNVLYYSSNRSASNGFPDIFFVKFDNILKTNP